MPSSQLSWQRQAELLVDITGSPLGQPLDITDSLGYNEPMTDPAGVTDGKPANRVDRSTIRKRIGAYFKGLRPCYYHRCLAVVLMAPAIVLSILFWRTSVRDPLTVSALLLDRILQFATALVLPLALLCTLLAPWRAARMAAITAAAISIVLGAATTMSALRAPVEGRSAALSVVTLISGSVLLVWVLHRTLIRTKWKLSFAALLAFLPAVQFWHTTSFVPGRLSSSLSATATVNVQQADQQERRGVVDVKLQNNSDIGALILASEVIMCFRESNANLEYVVENLYNDRDHCATSVIVTNLSQVEAKSSWTHHQSFRAPVGRPFAQLVVQVWYARVDRLRVDIASEQKQPGGSSCPGELTIYRLEDEARFRGVVQRDRFLVFRDDLSGIGDRYHYLIAEDESYCTDNSRYDIAGYVGRKEIRIHHEDWLQSPK